MSEILKCDTVVAPRQLKNLLTTFRISPSKRLGQNFIVNQKLVSDIVESLDLGSDDQVIEVGGGLGAITLCLAQQVANLSVFEIDLRLSELLRERIKEYDLQDRVEVVQQDFLIAESLVRSGSDCKVVSSLPYRATSPILHKLIIDLADQWLIGVFLMQHEVMKKIVSEPPGASYWYHLIRAFYNLEIIWPVVKPENFWPQPRVNSGLIKLTRKPGQESGFSMDPASWSRFLHRVFKYPRKQIKNSIDSEILTKAGIKTDSRPGQILMFDLVRLFGLMEKSTRVFG